MTAFGGSAPRDQGPERGASKKGEDHSLRGEKARIFEGARARRGGVFIGRRKTKKPASRRGRKTRSGKVDAAREKSPLSLLAKGEAKKRHSPRSAQKEKKIFSFTSSFLAGEKKGVITILGEGRFA